jgi:hypothetical protein
MPMDVIFPPASINVDGNHLLGLCRDSNKHRLTNSCIDTSNEFEFRERVQGSQMSAVGDACRLG